MNAHNPRTTPKSSVAPQTPGGAPKPARGGAKPASSAATPAGATATLAGAQTSATSAAKTVSGAATSTSGAAKPAGAAGSASSAARLAGAATSVSSAARSAGAAGSASSAARPAGAAASASGAAKTGGGAKTASAQGGVRTRPRLGKLALDPKMVAKARELARRAGQPVVDMARSHTTVSVERAVLRLAGITGADADGIPWVNRIVDQVREDIGLGHGVALPVFHALGESGVDGDLTLLAQKAAAGSVRFTLPEGKHAAAAMKASKKAVAQGIKTIDANRVQRDRLIKKHGDPKQRPWIYLIVATGDIYEDIPQAQAAARAGADVIAVIRSTGQSLLDYVPEGATREGFAGTYATQENFRLMRAALDESSKELGRYIRLTNYASGLCMPEIATLAGLQRLDMMLNDSMYGILFRDINPIRTFVDQRFSRQIHARAGIIINTGEDNYLTTADAVEAAHTVTVSQLLNEYFAHEAGLEDWQLGLGHAFEINPDLPESFRLELAHALLARELFPEAPLKWMPPTKHMTGDVFRGNLLDGFFNLIGTLTGQGILLVGMMTEAVVTPWLSDRDIALQNVRYVLGAAGGLHEDFVPAPGGFIQGRAHQVLSEAVDLLKEIVDDTLLNAIADGTFGIMKRPANRGKGLDGVAKQEAGYYNPATEILEAGK